MIKVLSLFNGMNCIGLALHSLGIDFKLYASEIDKYATKVSDKLFPNTINLGDVTKIDLEKLPVFDLVVGGSPCQGFSFAGKQLNFDDDRSKLFFDFVKIVEYCKKKNPELKFLLENVKMKQQHEAVISRFMGIDPIEINSSLLSAQNRRRLYWTNIGTTKVNLFGIEQPGIKQPKDKGILLKDILEAEVDKKYFLSDKGLKRQESYNNFNKCIDTNNKSLCLTAGYYKNGRDNQLVKIATAKNGKEVFLNKKSNLPCSFYETRTEKGKQERKELSRKNGKDTTPRNKDSKMYITQPHEKANCLVTVDSFLNKILIIPEAKIRRLTPKECARLQTIPSWAIEKMLSCGVSDSQLYKMLGNGWTVAVIEYILSHNNWNL